MSAQVRVKVDRLHQFVMKVLQTLDVPVADARITADVLLSADRRGIQSHGVARLKRYVDGIQKGIIRPQPEIRTVRETPVSLVIDGGGGLGHVIAYRTMQRCIAKAKDGYLCLATIRNSNHFGIAGFYALMALAEDLMGISMTNSAPMVVPTFARDAVIGTNPIAVGVPGKEEKAFFLDMATSTATRGKLEDYARKEAPIPESWACNEEGRPEKRAPHVLQNMLDRVGGGLFPLGGDGELGGGHKGYGLSALVDVFSGVLSGGAVGLDVYGKKGQPAEVCHFLGAIDPEIFIGREEIQNKIDYFMEMLRGAPRAGGQKRIFVAGEKEFEAEERNREVVPLQPKVYDNLSRIAGESGTEFNIRV